MAILPLTPAEWAPPDFDLKDFKLPGDLPLTLSICPGLRPAQQKDQRQGKNKENGHKKKDAVK